MVGLPNNHGFFLLKMISTWGVKWGVPPFKGNTHFKKGKLSFNPASQLPSLPCSSASHPLPKQTALETYSKYDNNHHPNKKIGVENLNPFDFMNGFASLFLRHSIIRRAPCQVALQTPTSRLAIGVSLETS